MELSQLSRVTGLRMVSLQCRAVAALIGRGKPIGWSQLMYVLDMGELEFAYLKSGYEVGSWELVAADAVGVGDGAWVATT